MKASLYGYSDIVRTLLEYGADATVKSQVRNRTMMILMMILMMMMMNLYL